MVAVGAVLGVTLLGLPTASADEMRCYRHTVVPAGRYSNISSVPVRVCSVEVRGGIGHADIIDSPNGLGTSTFAIFIAEPSIGTAGSSYSTGRLDTVTQYGLAVESSVVTTIVHWDSSDR